MKTFEIQHLFFEPDKVICTEEEFPTWLKHKEFKWFRDKHVLTLQPGESIESDFHQITRKE